MVSDRLTLGFDTSAAHCAAALLAGERILLSRAEEMERGQAERLLPLLEEVLAASGATWRDLSRIAVGIGPGNFTGIRISVAAARGLALARGIPCIGVGTFEVIRALDGPACLPAVPAPRDQAYIERPGAAPELVALTGIGGLSLPPPPATLAETIARLGARAPEDSPAPAPLYLRPADAAPARDLPPVILDDAPDHA